MQTTLKKYGANSQAIVIPKAIGGLYDFLESAQVKFETKANELVIHVKSTKTEEPSKNNEPDQRFQKSWSEVSNDFSDVFKSLANK